MRIIKNIAFVLVLSVILGNVCSLINVTNQEMLSTKERSILNDKYQLESVDSEDSIKIIDNNADLTNDFSVNVEPRTGTQRFAVICVKFKDLATTRWTTAGIGGLMATLNIFWQNTSYGLIDISNQISGWHTLSKNKTDYGKLDDAFHEIVVEAIEMSDGEFDWEEFDGILVWLNTQYSGISTIGRTYSFPDLIGNKKYSVSMVGENPADSVPKVWGRVAHEMGHALGLRHTHGDGDEESDQYYASYYSLMARGYPSGLNIYSQLFDKKSGWFNTDTNQIVVNPGDAGNYSVYPRHLNTVGITQALQIKITDSYYYRVEVIQKTGEDGWVPFEGVLIYRVNEGMYKDDQCYDQDDSYNSTVPDYYDCLWGVGGYFDDDKNDIYIRIVEKIGNNYKIEVLNYASGFVDLKLADWGSPEGNTPPYESQDIWIDSPINGWGKLRYHDEFNNPIGNGDEPWADHENRLYAMVHNIGDADAVDFDVYFYNNYPLGAGGDNDWVLVGIKNVPLLPKGESLAVYVPWTPNIGYHSGNDFMYKYHSCVKVIIIADEFELVKGNNEAQENIAYFEVTAGDKGLMKLASSQFEPITTTVKISNPLNEPKKIYINILDEGLNWNVTGDGIGYWHDFSALETKEFDITVTPLDEIRVTDKTAPSLFVGYIESYENESDFYPDANFVTLQSLTLVVTAMYRSEIEIDAAVRTNTIQIFGDVLYLDGTTTNHKPTSDYRNILLVITNTDTDEEEYFIAQYNEDGSFDYDYSIIIQGNYSVIAYFSGTEKIAKSFSVTLLVNTITGEVSTSKTNLFPGFKAYVLLGVITTMYVGIRMKKRKNF
ncbi:MAG: hypothetical protein JXA54_06860 [Candidatus Heimdallarchaeota archaeon]|nr:hypothetical protein [Candidatus Heimdallarchaeota archaeon]